jgi:hypothetical protein
MGTVTKVMFGLIILAGSGGIFMSLSMIPGKINVLKDAQKTSGENETAAKQLAQAQKIRADGLDNDLSVKEDNLKKVTKERDGYKGQYDAVMQGKAGAQKLIDDANAAKEQAERDKVAAETKYKSTLKQNTSLGQENARLSKYKDISFKGQSGLSDVVIQGHLADLEDRLNKEKVTTKIPKTKPRKKATVENVDTNYGYITIPDVNQAAKKGDKYLVTRGGGKIGEIIVNAIKGGKLYCIIDRENTLGIAGNPKTGDIKVGDTVAPKN